MNSDQPITPRHVAIIMDGNRRWARERGKTAVEGHKYVVDHVLEPLVDRCIELGISYLTLWAFSTENWDRDKAELQGLMKIFRYGLSRKTNSLAKKGVKLQVLGELERFPSDIVKLSNQWMEQTADNNTITVSFALNYGGRDEIRRSINRWLQQQSQLPEEITEENISENLDSAELPDPDLIIRPGGQLRLSGFMPWQAVYAELYFTDVLMPDFSVEELDRALQDFAQRQRRFGK